MNQLPQYALRNKSWMSSAQKRDLSRGLLVVATALLLDGRGRPLTEAPYRLVHCTIHTVAMSPPKTRRPTFAHLHINYACDPSMVQAGRHNRTWIRIRSTSFLQGTVVAGGTVQLLGC